MPWLLSWHTLRVLGTACGRAWCALPSQPAPMSPVCGLHPQLRDLLTRLGPTFIKAGQVRCPCLLCCAAMRCAALWLAGQAGTHLHQGRPGALPLLCCAALCYADSPAVHAGNLSLRLASSACSLLPPAPASRPCCCSFDAMPRFPCPLPCRCWPTGPTLCGRTT